MRSRQADRRRFQPTSSSKRAPWRFTSRISCSGDPAGRRPDVRVVYADSLGRIGPLDDPRLDPMSERHLIPLLPPAVAAGDAIAALTRDESLGLVLEIAAGCPDPEQLALLRRGLDLRRRVWLFWPAEGAAEVGTYERLASYRRHRNVIRFYERVVAPLFRMIALPLRVSYALRDMPSRDMPRWFLKHVLGLAGPLPMPPDGSTPDQGPETRTVPPMLRHAHRLAAL